MTPELQEYNLMKHKIIALSFGNTEGDSPSVFVVDIEKLTPAWRATVEWQIKFKTTWKYNLLKAAERPPAPDEWESLSKARVKLPCQVDYAVHCYYEG